MTIESGLIFKQSDMFFYKGFFKFQMREYAECVRLFSKSMTLKTLANDLPILNVEEGDMEDLL